MNTADPFAIVDFATAVAVQEESRPPPDKVLKGNPLQRVRNLFTDSTEQFFSGIWSSSPGTWRVKYTENEFCHLLEGSIRLTDEKGRTATFKAGSSFVVPAGFSGTWEVVEPARKLYVIFDPKP